MRDASLMVSSWGRIEELRVAQEELSARRKGLEQRCDSRMATMKQFNVVRLSCAKRAGRLCGARRGAALKRNEELKRKVDALHHCALRTMGPSASCPTRASKNLDRARSKFNGMVEHEAPQWRERVQRERIYRLRRLENMKRRIHERRERASAGFEQNEMLLERIKERESEVLMMRADETLDAQRRSNAVATNPDLGSLDREELPDIPLAKVEKPQRGKRRNILSEALAKSRMTSAKAQAMQDRRFNENRAELARLSRTSQQPPVTSNAPSGDASRGSAPTDESVGILNQSAQDQSGAAEMADTAPQSDDDLIESSDDPDLSADAGSESEFNQSGNLEPADTETTRAESESSLDGGAMEAQNDDRADHDSAEGSEQGDELWPTYLWQVVPDGIELPSTLEVKSAPDGTTECRIPPSWHLAAYVVAVNEPPVSIPQCRVQINREMRACDIILAIHESSGPACNLLTMYVEDDFNNRIIDFGNLNDPQWQEITADELGWDLFSNNFVVIVNVDHAKLRQKEEEAAAASSAAPSLPPNKPGALDNAKGKEAPSTPPPVPDNKPVAQTLRAKVKVVELTSDVWSASTVALGQLVMHIQHKRSYKELRGSKYGMLGRTPSDKETMEALDSVISSKGRSVSDVLSIEVWCGSVMLLMKRTSHGIFPPGVFRGDPAIFDEGEFQCSKAAAESALALFQGAKSKSSKFKTDASKFWDLCLHHLRWIVREKVMTKDEVVGAFSFALLPFEYDLRGDEAKRHRALIRAVLGDELTTAKKKKGKSFLSRISSKKKKDKKKEAESKKASSVMKKMSAMNFDDDLDIDEVAATPVKSRGAPPAEESDDEFDF